MNIYDLIKRAQELRDTTQMGSVSPELVGKLHEDTLKYINEYQLLASSPAIHKIYASVSAMQGDASPKSDLTGRALVKGQLVVIVPASSTDATAGDVYRYNGPSGNTSGWTYVSKIGGVPADAELSTTSKNPVQNAAVAEAIIELSDKAVIADDTEVVLANAFQAVSTSLKKGMIIERIGDAKQLILRKEDGSEERITPPVLPYTLTFNVVAVLPTTDVAGSKVIVKNLIDSKLDTLESDTDTRLTQVESDTDWALGFGSYQVYSNITLPINRYFAKGEVIRFATDADNVSGVTLGGYIEGGGQEDIVKGQAAGVLTVITLQKNYSKLFLFSGKDVKASVYSNDSVKGVLEAETEELYNNDTNLAASIKDLSDKVVMVDDTEVVLANAFQAVSTSLKKGMIIERIGDAKQLILRKEDGSEERITPPVLPYTLAFNVVAVTPTTDVAGSKVIAKNLIDSKLGTLKTEIDDEIQMLSDRQNISTEGVSISLKDSYYVAIPLLNPLKKGMIIESIGDATGVYIRDEQGGEVLVNSLNLPYTLDKDIVAIIPISNASGDMVVKSLVDSKLERIESSLGSWKTDFSNAPHIAIPLPTSLVRVNISAERFPTTKFDGITGYIEFIDHNGNYFKKPIEAIALQGSTSLSAPKKNLKFDFSDCTMKVGEWVTQDSFHLKSNYFDVFRGKSNLAYDLWRRIIEHNRSEAFRTPYINSDGYSWYGGVDAMDNDFNEARLTPAGFPIELYFNDEYMGIYTWNIKKDRANYAMDKKNADNIHIDPSDISTLISGESVIWENFEIRNPKSLITMNGGEYDGDSPLELIDGSSSAYDSSSTDHRRSAEVKATIIAFKDACADVIAKKDKSTFEKYFDKDWFVDFNIWGNVILDGDGLTRNTQYLYWGGKWYPAPYDCDQIYGNNWRGNFIYRKSRRIVNVSVLGQDVGIYDVFLSLYATDIKQRYGELRNADVISPNAIISQISNHVDLIGKDAYVKEFEKWNETPSYREPNDNPQWHYEGDYFEGTPSQWNDTSSYKVGEYVFMTIEGDRYYWRCLAANTGVKPYYDKYVSLPIVGGFFDSLTRTEKWLTVRFDFLDNYFKNE